MPEQADRNRRLIDRVTSPAFVESLDDLALPVLLDRIKVCSDVDLEFSFYRRLIQGRVDILDFALRGARAHLPAALPEILARHGSADTNVRFRRGHLLELLRSRLPEPVHLMVVELLPVDPPVRAPEWIPEAGRRDIDRELSDDLVPRLEEAPDAEIAATRDRLAGVERRISQQRQAVLETADALERAALRRLKAQLDREATVHVVEWVCDNYVRHLTRSWLPAEP